MFIFNKKNLSLICSLLPSLSFGFFCPNNFNQIELGYSEAQVLQICGKPAQQETKNVKPSQPQEWNYFVKQVVSTVTNGQTLGTLKMQITFDTNGNAINLSVNGIGVGSTAICGPLIQLNDSKQKIKAACGSPAFINQPQTDNPSTANSDGEKVTSYTYDSSPPVTLTFEKGILTSKE